MSFLPGIFAGAGCVGPSYFAESVGFDGSSTWLTRDTGLGAADSKLFTISFWFQSQLDGGAQQDILNSSSAVGGGLSRSVTVARSTSNNIQIWAKNSGATNILNVSTSTDTAKIATGWIHVLASFDMADAGKRHLYLNDISHLDTVTTYTNDTIDFTPADFGIGATPNGSNKITADLADFWHMPGTYIDFSVTSNRRLFINPALKPVYLGAAGGLPTGTSALVFHSGTLSTWHTNDGSGGGFTENGALTAGATSPSQ